MKLKGACIWSALAASLLAAGPALADDPQAQAGEQATGSEESCTDIGSTIDFATDSAQLSANGRKTLDAVANWMAGGTDRKVLVEGYADRPGSEQHNQALSERRAEAAKQYLISKGADPGLIATEAHGQQADKVQVENRRAVEVRTCALSCMAMTEPAPGPVAEAQPTMPAEPEPVDVIPPVPTTVREAGTFADRVGVQAALGGGVTGFRDQEARNFTDVGGSWEARLTFGTHLPFAVEAAYVGSAQNITALGLDSSAALVGNGAEGTARWNITRTRLQPYLFGGLGWTTYRLANDDFNTSAVREKDTVMTVPFGAGLGYRVTRAFVFDLRFTGRTTFGDDLFDAAYAGTGREAELGNWNVGGRLGWEF
jgi:hypothetical protein